MSHLAIFDCDSTLSSIEGIDELARLRGDDVLEEVAALTNAAMDGEVPLDEVFGRRIDIICPDQSICDQVAQLYIDTIEPTAVETMDKLRQQGWTPMIISGGFEPLIRPLANHLGIECVEAVPLYLDEKGEYQDFDRTYPTTRNGGKPEIIEKLFQQYGRARSFMVGDGVSDMETKGIVDTFFGYGGYTRRALVEKGADVYLTQLDQLFARL